MSRSSSSTAHTGISRLFGKSCFKNKGDWAFAAGSSELCHCLAEDLKPAKSIAFFKCHFNSLKNRGFLVFGFFIPDQKKQLFSRVLFWCRHVSWWWCLQRVSEKLMSADSVFNKLLIDPQSALHPELFYICHFISVCLLPLEHDCIHLNGYAPKFTNEMIGPPSQGHSDDQRSTYLFDWMMSLALIVT